MFSKIFKNNREENLGLNLKPGDNHYRAYVGPPKDYDLISAMVFNLLTCIGLRQDHRVLDIGCGSLRNGRLLIPYLNKNNYIGIEPNKWLVEDGIKNEIGRDLVKLKKPTFSYCDSMKEFNLPLNIDYAFAQSIFSHTGLDLLDKWLSDASYHLKDDGILLATFLIDEKDSSDQGWIYPGCVKFIPETVSKLALKHGFNFKLLDWFHPRQSWAAFYKKDYDTKFISNDIITWNEFGKHS
ncbi:class I SAM-dependent methyltransferase [Simiduia aestuariiviva]|uniref:Cyclopropane fatty-acyl-phospholipid synthase-like methyltransferase n=1 Tax=Simiduia aestuariiviva TaxID=1510459 RepID=A0A839UPU0_9GAMM|nr:class I SAM-dependent methyltransferase [Simiduia aestuariiviva]MBB3167395.1 cyclopropane fatty-acyl-phospholipid synthase-like methyltransferase [Simiduia aestuariiviva]